MNIDTESIAPDNDMINDMLIDSDVNVNDINMPSMSEGI